MATHRLTALSLATLAVATPMVGNVSPAQSAFAAHPRFERPAELSPSAMSIDETQAVIDPYLAALAGREEIAPYLSDDVVIELVDVGQRIQGRDEVVATIVELHEVTFDARPEVTNVVIGEGTAAAELVFVGTHTGEFAGIPASGKEVAVPYAAFYDVADGKITAVRIHGFATGLVAALTAGAAPAPGTSAP
jgi:steroid delta-isomerase-like uncharacterized protein